MLHPGMGCEQSSKRFIIALVTVRTTAGFADVISFLLLLVSVSLQQMLFLRMGVGKSKCGGVCLCAAVHLTSSSIPPDVHCSSSDLLLSRSILKPGRFFPHHREIAFYPYAELHLAF